MSKSPTAPRLPRVLPRLTDRQPQLVGHLKLSAITNGAQQERKKKKIKLDHRVIISADARVDDDDGRAQIGHVQEL